MKTTGIHAIDVVLPDVSQVAELYVQKLGFMDCGFDGEGHMTKVGEFHIYFRPGWSSSVGNNVVPVLQTESIMEMYRHLQALNMQVSPLKEYSETFRMFEVTDDYGITWSFAGA